MSSILVDFRYIIELDILFLFFQLIYLFLFQKIKPKNKKTFNLINLDFKLLIQYIHIILLIGGPFV